MARLYVTTVKIALAAENEAEACDAMSAALTENLEQSGAIVDWGYATGSGNFKDLGEYIPDEYSEGQAIL